MIKLKWHGAEATLIRPFPNAEKQEVKPGGEVEVSLEVAKEIVKTYPLFERLGDGFDDEKERMALVKKNDDNYRENQAKRANAAKEEEEKRRKKAGIKKPKKEEVKEEEVEKKKEQNEKPAQADAQKENKNEK